MLQDSRVTVPTAQPEGWGGKVQGPCITEKSKDHQRTHSGLLQNNAKAVSLRIREVWGKRARGVGGGGGGGEQRSPECPGGLGKARERRGHVLAFKES